MKTRINNVAEASVVNVIFAALLVYFKTIDTIPMSTTWVFLGLMGGREIGIAIEGKSLDDHDGKEHGYIHALKLGGNDLVMGILGLLVSVGIVVLSKL